MINILFIALKKLDVQNPDLHLCVERRLNGLNNKVKHWKGKVTALKHESGVEIKKLKNELELQKIDCKKDEKVR